MLTLYVFNLIFFFKISVQLASIILRFERHY